jgi:hypothetical protein
MTAERQAADAIALAVAPRLCVRPPGECDPALCSGCLHDAERAGRAAVETLAAAGLVIAPAARVADLLDALRQAEARLAADRRDIVDCHTLPNGDARRDEATMDALGAEAVAELDALLAAIRAAAGMQAGMEAGQDG